MTPTDDTNTDQTLTDWKPAGHRHRTAAEWPTHRAKGRRQHAQRRALGRAPRPPKRGRR